MQPKVAAKVACARRQNIVKSKYEGGDFMTFGKKLGELRKENGISQEKLAELVGVSRQAVTKWESGKSNPDTENLIRLAEVFGVSVDELCGKESAEKRPEPKLNPFLAAIPPLVFIIYIIISAAAKTVEAGTVICLFVICFPMNLAVPLFFGNAIKTGDFSLIAGFDPETEYNYPEVKRYLVALGWFLNIITVFHSAMIALTALIIGGNFTPFLLMGYIVSYIAAVLFMGYKYGDRLYANPKDAERTKRGFPSAVALVVMIFLSVGALGAVFEIKEIENNTLPVLEICGMMFLSVGLALAGYLIEQRRLKKSDEHAPLFGKAFTVLNILAVLVLVLMAII